MPEIQKVEGPPFRIETGVVQFGDDRPGTFIRGDEALMFSVMLEDAERHLEGIGWGDPYLGQLKALRRLLRAARVGGGRGR